MIYANYDEYEKTNRKAYDKFNESITRKIKNLEKYLWDEQSESKYKHEPNIEKIIEEIQKSHKEDDFYLSIHKFDYVEPENTEA